MRRAVGPHGNKKPRLQTWQTPPRLVEVLVEQYGLQVDAACTDDDAVLPERITKAEDALATPWRRPVFYNPPYSRQGEWVEKAFVEAMNGTLSVGLVQVAMSSAWFWRFALYGEVHFFDARLAFHDPATGRARRGSDFDSCLVIMRAGLEGAGRIGYRSARSFQCLPAHAMRPALANPRRTAA